MQPRRIRRPTAAITGNHFFEALFVRHAPAPIPTIENVVVGPLIAVLSFVCSVGNVPLAAVLWSGGISFGGVLAYLFADPIVLPIFAIYRRYCGGPFALRITALMLITMVLAASIVNGLFGLVGAIPAGTRPSRANIFGAVRVHYKLFLNLLGAVNFGALLWLTARRGATDPVCGMRVDRATGIMAQARGESSISARPSVCMCFSAPARTAQLSVRRNCRPRQTLAESRAKALAVARIARSPSELAPARHAVTSAPATPRRGIGVHNTATSCAQLGNVRPRMPP